MDNLDIPALLKAAKEHPIAADMYEPRFLAAIGYTLNKLTDAKVRIPHRRIRNDKETILVMRDGEFYGDNTYYCLQVNEELFNSRGPTSWEQIKKEHNQTQDSPARWRGDPLDGGEHFADILQGAGEGSIKIWTLRDHLLALWQSQQLQDSTPTVSNNIPGRRM